MSTNATRSFAQVIEDKTLSSGENTQVIFTGDTYEITGGALRNNSLFHSFDSFSIELGQTADFLHGNGVDTIINRVTGSLASQIDGTVRTGDVDFFLINPQGIFFGPEASLDIGGSFIASTAANLVLADGVEFSATNPQPVPLLTISQPAGLVLGDNSRNIVNEAFLEVLPGETLSLISNGIDLLVGGLIALSGRVDLASLAPGNSIELIAPSSINGFNWALDYENLNEQDFRDIQLLDGGFVDTTSDFDDNPNGIIQLRGRQVFLGEASEIINRNFGTSQGGEITIVASGKLTMDGALISSSTFTNGDGGDVIIEALENTVELIGTNIFAQSVESDAGTASKLMIRGSNLSIREGSIISTSTFGSGDAGELTLEIAETVELLDNSNIFTESVGNATGKAGTLLSNSLNFRVQGGSNISTSTSGNGLGGKLLINTPDGFTEIFGTSLNNNNIMAPSRLFSTTQGNQDAGEIRINTRILLIQDGGIIDAGTFGNGDGGITNIQASELVVVSGQLDDIQSSITSSNGETGGNAGAIEISTRRLVVQDGGQIFTSTNSSSQGGDLTVKADEVFLSGQGNDSDSENNLTGLFARTEGSGDSGRLDLTADELLIENGARITVSTDDDAPIENLGTVRDANITARTVTLDNGQITAESLSGNGGILNFNVEDFILLRNGSLISATAGTDESGGDGGNIFITMPDGFLIGIPNEDSDIIANAFKGTGGNINITALNIFNLEERSSTNNTSTNDIDASSAFGEDGIIVINNVGIDPTQGTIELPSDTAQPQIARRCLADSEGQSAFVVTGQGGVPPSPRDVVRNETAGLVDLGSDASGITRQAAAPQERSNELLVEAQAWQRNDQGDVVLFAQASAAPGGYYTADCSTARGL